MNNPGGEFGTWYHPILPPSLHGSKPGYGFFVLSILGANTEVLKNLNRNFTFWEYVGIPGWFPVYLPGDKNYSMMCELCMKIVPWSNQN